MSLPVYSFEKSTLTPAGPEDDGFVTVEYEDWIQIVSTLVQSAKNGDSGAAAVLDRRLGLREWRTGDWRDDL